MELSPKQYKMPTLSSTDTSARAALELFEALKHPHPKQCFAPLKNNALAALKELSAIFSDTTTKTTALTTSDNPSTTKMIRAREAPPRVESRKAVEATRLEEVQEDIRPQSKQNVGKDN